MVHSKIMRCAAMDTYNLQIRASGKRVARNRSNGSRNDYAGQLPDGLKSIPADTFNRCYELTDLKLPSALSEIGDHAFAFTNHLESIEFPADLSMIASYAFSCSALKDIRFLGAPPISIANSSFDSVEATVYYSYNSSSWNDENLLSYGGALTWVGFNGTSDEFHIVSGAYDANVTWTFNPYEKALEISGYGDTSHQKSPFFDGKADRLKSCGISGRRSGRGSVFSRYA